MFGDGLKFVFSGDVSEVLILEDIAPSFAKTTTNWKTAANGGHRYYKSEIL